MSADTISPPQAASKSNKPQPDGFNSGPEESDERTATLTQTTDGLKRAGAAYMAVGSDNMSAIVEANGLMLKLMTDLARSQTDALSHAAVTYAGLGRDCLTCRTPADVVELQKKAVDSLRSTYDAAGQVYTNLFGAFSNAMQPLIARSADGPERMFRAFAD